MQVARVVRNFMIGKRASVITTEGSSFKTWLVEAPQCVNLLLQGVKIALGGWNRELAARSHTRHTKSE
jgi:hypothetical protein